MHMHKWHLISTKVNDANLSCAANTPQWISPYPGINQNTKPWILPASLKTQQPPMHTQDFKQRDPNQKPSDRNKTQLQRDNK